MTSQPVPVSGEDQPNPRVEAAAQALFELFGSQDARETAYTGHRLRAKQILHAVDLADHAAGIRRITVKEAIERAARQDYVRVMKYGPSWEEADERKREASRARVRRVVQAALG